MGQAWWLRPVIPESGGSAGRMMTMRPAWAKQQNPVTIKKKINGHA
jgi:hypothetical protein